MKMPKKIIEAAINGHPVSFYEPPHHEPDLPWVEGKRLLYSFAVKGCVRVSHSSLYGLTSRGGAAGDLICHCSAAGMCDVLDRRSGSATIGGRAFSAYTEALLEAVAAYGLTGEDFLKALDNAGGPIWRKAVEDME